MKTDIERTLPSGNPLVQLQVSPVVVTLRQLMDQVREIKEERDAIEGQLKDAKCDMSQYQSVILVGYMWLLSDNWFKHCILMLFVSK